MSVTDQKYHTAIVPLDDIYTLGGPTVFEKLQAKENGKKNLIVLPDHVFTTLNNLNETTTDDGAKDTADEILKYQDSNKIIFRNEEVSVYRISDRLDLAMTHSSEPNLINLEGKIKTLFSANQGVEFITNNSFNRVKLRNSGLKVEKSKFLLADATIVNKGIITTDNYDFQAKLFQAGEKGLSLNDFDPTKYFDFEDQDDEDKQLFMNQFIKTQGKDGNFKYARVVCNLIRKKERVVDYNTPRILLLREDEYSRVLTSGNKRTNTILGISANNMEQYIALQYGLLNPDVTLFFISGAQGSGKTIISYVAAMEQILSYNNQRSQFEKIVLFKPNNIMGGKERDIGFLPGSMYEKIKEHLKPFMDAHNHPQSALKGFSFDELLKHPRYENEYGKRMTIPKLPGGALLPQNNEAIEMTYSGFARGRTFSNTLMVIDEGENLTPYEMKTLIERSGVGTKIIVIGDPFQVDNPKCTREINGLTHAIKQYLPMPYSALLHLPENFRSEMSRDSASWHVYNN